MKLQQVEGVMRVKKPFSFEVKEAFDFAVGGTGHVPDGQAQDSPKPSTTIRPASTVSTSPSPPGTGMRTMTRMCRFKRMKQKL